MILRGDILGQPQGVKALLMALCTLETSVGSSDRVECWDLTQLMQCQSVFYISLCLYAISFLYPVIYSYKPWFFPDFGYCEFVAMNIGIGHILLIYC